MVEEAIGDGSRYGLKVDFVYDGPRLLGTAGTVKHALPLLGEDFFVMNGDTYLPCDFQAVQTHFERCSAQGLMTVCDTSDGWERGNVRLEGNRIADYDKQQHNSLMLHVDAGLGVFNKSAYEAVPADQPYDQEALYRLLLSQRQLAVHQADGRFYEIGSFAGLGATRRYLAQDG